MEDPVLLSETGAPFPDARLPEKGAGEKKPRITPGLLLTGTPSGDKKPE